MSLARTMARRNKKAKAAQQPEIRLQNPVADHYATFVVGNAFAWQGDALRDIEAKAPSSILADIISEFQECKPGFALAKSTKFQAGLDAFCDEGRPYVVQENSAQGQTLVICGAGPSLGEHAQEYCSSADQVWGCNSALAWLTEHGHKVTHGFTVDQTQHMVNEWFSAPDVGYIVASTIHPHLGDYLRSKGRRLSYFHNYVGIARPPVTWQDADGNKATASYEQWLYITMFPTTIMVGSGLNTVTRAIDVARYMGFAKIIILGADCALRVKSRPPKDAALGSPELLKWLREETVMHVDGGHALASEASALTLGCELDPGTTGASIRPGHGRYWQTKFDLMISAVWLTKFAQKYPEQIRLVGDTLPNALMKKSDAFLKTRYLAKGQEHWFPQEM